VQTPTKAPLEAEQQIYYIPDMFYYYRNCEKKKIKEIIKSG
jgi:hypothetical protein